MRHGFPVDFEKSLIHRRLVLLRQHNRHHRLAVVTRSGDQLEREMRQLRRVERQRIAELGAGAGGTTAGARRHPQYAPEPAVDALHPEPDRVW